MMIDQTADLLAASQVLAQHGRLFLAGAGPNAAIAREGALKVKESSFVTAEGFELENALHGALQAVQPGDLAVVLVANDQAADRGIDLIRALQVIGAQVLVVADARLAGQVQSVLIPQVTAWVVPYPAVPSLLSPVLTVVPLQLLAAFTAALRGTNADNFRFDEPAYKKAVLGYVL
jgi:glucosamine--fructose-6-phosphate aminotransferase (isomerizing)